MNWLWVGGVSFILYTGAFTYCLAKGRFSKTGLAVGLANLALALLHSVAPIRGWADPDYLGYSFGLLRVGAGPWVTVVTGAILGLAVFSACAAGYGARGRKMFLVGAFDAAVAINVAIILVGGFITDSSGAQIHLGEYLTIPPLPATLILVSLFFLPLSLAAIWAFKRAS